MGFNVYEGLESFHEHGTVRNVCIIGAGVAGLQTARLLSDAGLSCTVLEAAPDIGGVWRENYADFGLQVPKDLYEFPGFPFPEGEHWDLFPSGAQVHRYIRLYAERFDLLRLVRLRTKVLGVEASPSGWLVRIEGPEGLSVEEFDFLVCSTGMYSSHPNLPVARGAEHFRGEVLHSCTFKDRSQAAGRRVVVVGGGKSAVDNAVAAAKAGAECTLLSREAHWPVPRYLMNLVPFKWGTYSRFGHFMLEAHHDEGPLSSWVHAVCRPLKWMFWRAVEFLFCLQFSLSGDQVPTMPIEHDLFTGGQILTYEFRDMLAQGKVRFVKGSVSRFSCGSVVLDSGRELDADLVIYGTGFRKSYDVFDQATQAKLGAERDGLYLYRNMLPPNVPRLAFIGSEVSTFNNILTHGLQALWLQRLLTGQMSSPPRGRMMLDVEREQAWKRSWMPPSSARASIWQLHMTRYHDILCRDIGTAHRRKGNPLAEVFCPYGAKDYAGLFTPVISQ